MFKIFRKRRNRQALIEQLQGEVDRLAQRNEELSAQVIRAVNNRLDVEAEFSVSEKMAEQRLETITAMKERIAEAEKEIKFLESVHETNKKLASENAQLREGAGHALHALAAVQDVSSAFVKRLDMLPPMCGLPQDLVESVFADFDTDLEARKEYTRELTQSSYQIEKHADDNGVLVISPDDNTTDYLTVDEVQKAVFDRCPDPDFDIKWPNESIEQIHELGLYTFKLDLGKQITADIKVWVVPTAEDLE